ncbi:MAG: hypothetical protein CL955_06350 [Erythrobacteraceae bacterium]|nr:hypothetical protein [Erythrobacteraceae bacterium]
MKSLIAVALSLVPVSAVSAQILPMPGPETPRIQTARWAAGQPIVLTALPDTTLTVMLEPGEAIRRATLSGSRAWDVSVSAEADSFQVTPQMGAAPASLLVETDGRSYEFSLETGQGLMAAYLVRLEYGPPASLGVEEATDNISDLTWSYRLRGDREVRPASVRDNGDKTVITYAPGQSLPAVFAIGPTGDEEVVDGYMRGEVFVIDRVHAELVFRIDKEKATARRNREEDEAQ